MPEPLGGNEMEQPRLFEQPIQGERAARMAWIDARIALFSTMTWEQRTEYVLNEVIARYEANAAPLDEVLHWRSRLTPVAPDRVCGSTGEDESSTRAAGEHDG